MSHERIDYFRAVASPRAGGEHEKFFTPKKGLFGTVPPPPPKGGGGTSPILRENKQKKTGFARLGGGHVPPVPPPLATGLLSLDKQLAQETGHSRASSGASELEAGSAFGAAVA